MALSTASITVNTYPKGVDNTQRNEVLRGTIKVTPGTYPPGGYALNWSNIEALKAIPDPTRSGVLFPVDMDIRSQASPPSGFIYFWNSVTGNMHIFVAANSTSANSGPLVEGVGASTSTIPGVVLNDTIAFVAYFTRE